MNLLQDLLIDKDLNIFLISFLDEFGISGLKQALQLYTNMEKKYICKTKTSISKINISDINYLEISGHNIAVNTIHGTYQKYGTLKKELDLLAPYGFIKCNQSCLVSLQKIKAINNNTIVLIDNSEIRMSRSCSLKVITAFSFNT